MKLRHDENTVNAAETGEVGHNLAGPHIENDEIAGVHVRDVKQSGSGVERLIIKADCRAGHGNVSDRL